MKRIIFVLITLLWVIAAVQAQPQSSNELSKSELRKDKRVIKKTERVELRKLDAKSASEKSRKSFEQRFGNVQGVSWQRTVDYDVATFTKEAASLSAYFDQNGELIGTAAVKSFNDLPAKGQRNLTRKYRDYTIGKIIFFDKYKPNTSPMILYDTPTLDMDSYYIELAKGAKRLIVSVDPKGNIAFFKQFK